MTIETRLADGGRIRVHSIDPDGNSRIDEELSRDSKPITFGGREGVSIQGAIPGPVLEVSLQLRPVELHDLGFSGSPEELVQKSTPEEVSRRLQQGVDDGRFEFRDGAYKKQSLVALARSVGGRSASATDALVPDFDGWDGKLIVRKGSVPEPRPGAFSIAVSVPPPRRPPPDVEADATRQLGAGARLTHYTEVGPITGWLFLGTDTVLPSGGDVPTTASAALWYVDGEPVPDAYDERLSRYLHCLQPAPLSPLFWTLVFLGATPDVLHDPLTEPPHVLDLFGRPDMVWERDPIRLAFPGPRARNDVAAFYLFWGASIQRLRATAGRVERKEVAALPEVGHMGQSLGSDAFPFLDLEELGDDLDLQAARTLEQRFAKKKRCVLVGARERIALLAMENPQDEATRAEVEERLGVRVAACRASGAGLRSALQRARVAG